MATKLNINAIRDNSVTANKLEKGAIKEAAELLQSLNSSNNPLSLASSVFAVTDNTGTWGLQSLDSLRATLETSYDTKYILRSSEDNLRVAAAWAGIDSFSDTSIYFDLDNSESSREYMTISGLVAYGMNDQDNKFYLYRPSKASILDILGLTRDDISFLIDLWFDAAFYEAEWLRDCLYDELTPYGAMPAYVEEVSGMDFGDGNPWYIPICRALGDYITDTDFPYLYTNNNFYLGDSILGLPCRTIWIHNDYVDAESSWGDFLWRANFRSPSYNYIEIPLLALSRHSGSWNVCQISHLADIKANKDGQLICAGIVEPSDINLKSNIFNLDVDLDSLKNISKVVYTFINDDEQKQHIGVIAQEVQKYYPEIVNKGSDGYLSVDYSKLSVIALKAIDMLDDRLKKIEEKLGI